MVAGENGCMREWLHERMGGKDGRWQDRMVAGENGLEERMVGGEDGSR